MDPTWILTGASILGVILNVKRKRVCFYIWAVTNFLWMVVDYFSGIYSQAALFGIYFILAVWGIFSWRTTQEDPCISNEKSRQLK